MSLTRRDEHSSKKKLIKLVISHPNNYAESFRNFNKEVESWGSFFHRFLASIFLMVPITLFLLMQHNYNYKFLSLTNLRFLFINSAEFILSFVIKKFLLFPKLKLEFEFKLYLNFPKNLLE